MISIKAIWSAFQDTSVIGNTPREKKMTIEKHDLLHEFPDHHHTIRHLKMNDNHFAKLFNQYNELDQEVRHIEEGIDAKSDEYLETCKKVRVKLKDELFGMIKQTEATL